MRSIDLRSAAFTALVAGSLGVPLTAAMAKDRTETERVTRTVPLAPGGTLKLKNFSGKVTITGTSGNEVAVEAVRRGTRERLDHIKLDIETSGSVVTVEANKRDGWLEGWFRHNGVVETNLDVKVPSRTNLQVSVFSSPVAISNVTGRHDVHAFSASLKLLDIAGPLRAHTFSGDLRVQLAASERQPELDLDTFSGDIEVRMPENATAGVSFRSFSGDLRSDIPLTLTKSSRRHLRATLNGREGHAVSFTTFSGDVHIVR